MRKLKFFGGNYCGQYRRIVSAISKKRAAELVGSSSLYEFNQFYCETGNNIELKLLTEHPPESVFETSIDNYYDIDWKQIR